MKRWMEYAIAALCGLIFGLGLIVAGMTNPAKVQGFLDLAGDWDPSLAFVMAGAIAVAILPFQSLRRRTQSLCGTPLHLPGQTKAGKTRLIIGSLLFGTGWGIAGFCPGPALVGLASAWLPALLFCAGMFAGFALSGRNTPAATSDDA
ncbi:MAG: YeeE/YedE family rane protein [Proteobacteria bacterium]|jgi:uncharacterized protein|nr:YeeE/YedE family rane protein [Pseudomonadota bacterium]